MFALALATQTREKTNRRNTKNETNKCVQDNEKEDLRELQASTADTRCQKRLFLSIVVIVVVVVGEYKCVCGAYRVTIADRGRALSSSRTDGGQSACRRRTAPPQINCRRRRQM